MSVVRHSMCVFVPWLWDDLVCVGIANLMNCARCFRGGCSLVLSWESLLRHTLIYNDAFKLVMCLFDSESLYGRSRSQPTGVSFLLQKFLKQLKCYISMYHKYLINFMIASVIDRNFFLLSSVFLGPYAEL